MKKEELYEGFGALKDEVLLRSEEGNRMKNRKRIANLIKGGSIAACLLIVLGAGVVWINRNDNDGDTISTSCSADVAPMIFVNDTLYKQSIEQIFYEERKDEFVYVGKIESDVSNDKSITDGVPTGNFQANTHIIGSEVYQYGDNIVVQVNGIYWLYEAVESEKSTVEWDKLSEEEKMQLDPMYIPD